MGRVQMGVDEIRHKNARRRRAGPILGGMRVRLAAMLLAVAAGGCGSSASQSPAASDASGAPESSGASAGDEDASLDALASSETGASSDAAAAEASPPIRDAPSGDDSSPETGIASDGGHLMTMYVTFYGWADNSPPGGAIAYPTIHRTAGGTGTYADPITFATDRAELAPGTILYVPFIEKYVVMEDDCAECDTDWMTSQKWHIDLWMNSNAGENTNALLACEDQWTRSSTSVEVDPPSDRLVTTAPLFDPSANVCRSSP